MSATNGSTLTTRQIGIRQRSLRRHCKMGRATELVFIFATGATLALSGGAGAQAVWDGTTDTNFTDATNYEGDTDPSNDAFILDDGATGNDPILALGDAITVTSGAVSAGILTIDGDLTATNGTTVSGFGSVINTGNLIGLVTNTGSGALTNTGTINGNILNIGIGAFNNIAGNSGNVTNAATGSGNAGTIGSLNNTDGTFGNSGAVTGDTAVEGGVVTLNGGSNLGDASAVTVSQTGTLTVSAADTVAGVTQSGGTIDGAATLTTTTFGQSGGDLAGIVSASGAKTLDGGIISGTLTGAGATTVQTGTTTVTGTIDGSVAVDGVGTLALESGAAINDTAAVTVAAGATLNVVNAETIGSLAGAGGMTLGATLTTGDDDSNTTFSGNATGAGGLIKRGIGSFTLSGTNAHTGATEVENGTLILSGGAAIANSAALIVSGLGVLQVDTAETVGSLDGSGNITLNATLTSGQTGFATAASGVISGVGGLTLEGTGALTLSGANTYDGLTTVQAGTLLTAASSTALGSTAAGTVVEAGGTLALSGGITVAEAITLNGTGGGGGALRNVSGGNVVTGPITLATDARINSDVGQVNINGGIGGTSTNLTVGGAGNTNIFSAIATGAGSLTKDGTGAVALSGTNTFTGGTTVNSGLLQLIDGSALADSGALTINAPAVLQVFDGETVGNLSGSGAIVLLTADALVAGGAGNTTFSGAIGEFAAVGAFTKAGSGTLTLSGANTFTGVTTVNAGTLVAASDAALGSAVGGTTVADGATLALRDGVTIGDAITLNGNGMANGGALRSLAGVNIVDGLITLATDARINNDGGGQFLDINGNITGTNTNLTVGGAGWTAIGGNITTGTGSLTIDQTGPFQVQLTGVNTFTGGTTINSGTLELFNGSALANTGAVTINALGTLRMFSGETIGALSGSGSIRLSTPNALVAGDGTDTVFSGVIGQTGGTDGAFTKAGTGTLTLSGINTYTGATLVNDGVLAVTGTGALASPSITTAGTGAFRTDGGALTIETSITNNSTRDDALLKALNFAGSESIASVNGAGTVLLDGAATELSLNTGASAISGIISGTGALTVQGTSTTTLSATNTYTGDTTVNAGTLNLNGGSAIDDAGAVIVNGGRVEVNADEMIGSLAGAGGVVDLNAFELITGGNAVLPTDSTTYAGDITGAGDLVKTGVGVMVLSGDSTYTGETDVTGGRLRITGSLDSLDIETAAGTFFETDGNALLIGTAITNAGELHFTGVESIARVNGGGTVFLDGAATVMTLNNGASAIDGVIRGTGGLVVTGASNVAFSDTTLSAENTYAGATSVTGFGVLRLVGAGSAGTLDSTAISVAGNGALVTDGGALAAGTQITNTSVGNLALLEGVNFNGSETIQSLNGTGTVDLGAGTLSLTTGASVIAGEITGSGALTVTGTSNTTLSAVNTYTGLTAINSGAATLNVTGTVSGAANVSAGTMNVTGGIVTGAVSSTGGTVNLASGGALNGGLTNNGATFNLLAGSTGTVSTLTNTAGSANVQTGATLLANTVTNSGNFSLGNGSAVDGSTFGNAGNLLVTGAASIASAFSNSSVINLGVSGDGTSERLVVDSVTGGNVGTVTSDINFAGTSADQFRSLGNDISDLDFAFKTIEINALSEKIKVADGLAANANLTSNLDSGGSIQAVFTQEGTEGFVNFIVNSGISGVVSAAAVTQSLISSVVNRPTSPFVSGLATEETCSQGGFARATGGKATVNGTSTSNGFAVSNDVSTRYGGLQGGYDFGCYDGRYLNGWDGAIGIMGGVNFGKSELDVFAIANDPSSAVLGQTGANFDQSYLGLYVSGRRGDFSGDVQLRFDRTNFELNDSADLGFDGQEFSTTTSTLGARVNYGFVVNEAKGIRFAPTAGFNIARTTGDTVNWAKDGEVQSLALDGYTATVGYIGATIAKQTIFPAGDGGIEVSAGLNYYQDFSGDRSARYTNSVTDPTGSDITIDGIGGFGEVSLGVNYLKVLEPGAIGAAKQLNASARLDARFGDNVSEAYSLTAQVRLSF